jgi:hypothetical protein
MINYDAIDDWSPRLGQALADAVPTPVRQRVATTTHEYIEDALESILRLVDRGQVIEATLRWIGENVVLAYHGTRVTDEERLSILTTGLRPLAAEQRRHRLVRALSKHPMWRESEGRLDEVLRSHSGTGKSGRREGQVHLTLSRAGLTSGFSHYLTHGSEFDQHVAHDLLGEEGQELLATDGTPQVVTVAVPGNQALEGAHPHLAVAETIARGELPNLVSQFLEVWAFKLSDVTYQSTRRKLDCGVWFRTGVPATWIHSIEPP